MSSSTYKKLSEKLKLRPTQLLSKFSSQTSREQAEMELDRATKKKDKLMTALHSKRYLPIYLLNNLPPILVSVCLQWLMSQRILGNNIYLSIYLFRSAEAGVLTEMLQQLEVAKGLKEKTIKKQEELIKQKKRKQEPIFSSFSKVRIPTKIYSEDVEESLKSEC